MGKPEIKRLRVADTVIIYRMAIRGVVIAPSMICNGLSWIGPKWSSRQITLKLNT